MATVTIAAVQAAYILMDQRACVEKAIALLHQAAGSGARIVVFPEVFIPGTPIWIDSRPIWDGDEDWYALLVDQAVVVPGPVTDALGAAARSVGAYVVIGVQNASPTARPSTTPPSTSVRMVLFSASTAS
jgi:nitrilase